MDYVGVLEDRLRWGARGWITLLAGGRGTETTVLLRFAMQTIVEQGPPCPVLQHPTFRFLYKQKKRVLGQLPPEKCRKHGKVPLEKCWKHRKVPLEKCWKHGKVPLEKCRKHRKVPLEKCEKACKKVKKKHILILVTNILQILFVTLPWLGNIAKTSHNIKNI